MKRTESILKLRLPNETGAMRAAPKLRLVRPMQASDRRPQCDPICGALERVRELAARVHPEHVLRDLLRAAACELDAWAYYVAADGHCRGPVGGGASSNTAGQPPIPITVGQALRKQIDAARASSNSAPSMASIHAPALPGNAHALLGTIPGAGHHAGRTVEPAVNDVLIAVRTNSVPFTAGDRAAMDILLLGASQAIRTARYAAQQERATNETVCTLANIIDARDNRTAGHSQRVSWLARLTGAALGLEATALRELEWAGALHDVGKLGVAERILNKPGPLSEIERQQVQQHPQLGCEILRPIAAFAPILEAVLHHHENHDGSGYPCGLRHEEIPPFARIIHVVDIFDALLSDRPYRRGMSLADAEAELRRGAGSITDPRVTTAFLDALKEFRDRNAQEFSHRFSQATRTA
jgi:HD-GYP domain-containing protein (c-di-GMP phosphodiesterase class II)